MPDGRIALLTDSANVLFLQRAPLYCQSENDIESIFSYDAEEVCVDLSEIISKADDPLIRSLADVEFGEARQFVRSSAFICITTGLHMSRVLALAAILTVASFLHITPTDAGNLSEGNEASRIQRT